ncbi:YegS/Rv2252/BmrU family lipid kinase [Pontibacillus salicampi]|uniref:YegS/Rv2252/BmrU family lipid kinase n=1 Tax=Pontibacillus salicampi TaxID=1449801 RepID=A0ABV6LN64_9BACI
MTKYQSGAFIYNGDAGGEGQLVEKLSQTVPILSQDVEALTVVQTNSKEDLMEKCERYGKEVEVLYILGGDGTMYDVINSIADMDNRPVIGVLPGGTCNDFSRMLGMPQNLAQAAQAIVNGQEAPVDIGKSQKRYFLNFWGIGLVTATSLNINPNQKNRFGALSYFLSAMKSMNDTNPFQYKITIDNEEVHEEQGVMVLVLNGSYIGTRMVPIPSLYVNDGKLDVLIVKSSTLKTFRELLSMNQPGTDIDKMQELTHLQAQTIKIETEDDLEIDTDGEVERKTPDEISVLPNHIRMIFHQDKV